MNVDDARILDALCYDLVLSDYPRGQNRALIQKLANGAPPYSDSEVEENGIVVNVNDLTHTRLCHDARSQFYNAFLKTGTFAQLVIDAGPVHKRQSWSTTATKEWNKILKNDITFYERLRAEFGLLVLHGISPAVWEDQDQWCPRPLGVEDVLLPGETLLGFQNLPFFVLRRSFTGIELMRLTANAGEEAGWNMDLVNRILAWLEDQTTTLRSQNWPDVWSPEKIAERTKTEAGATLAGDRAPKMDVFDIYSWQKKDGVEGWVRRMILDSWSEPTFSGSEVMMSRSAKKGPDEKVSQFLFSSKDRIVANDWKEIVGFQFADLSATFPARYHSVRSLGWLTYASSHIQNRLRCKFYESVFEALMQLYEVESQEDAQNALKLNLINHGFIDKTIRPVKSSDRWQVNAGLVELGLSDVQRVIRENAASWMQSPNMSQDRTEKTRFQVMAELQAMSSLVGAAFSQAYMYQSFEFREIFRRFCRSQSTARDVRTWRDRCQRAGIPAKYLNDPDAWQVIPEKPMGDGNKTMEMTIAGQLMEWRDKFDAEPQRDILRGAVLAWTGDAARAEMLVPHAPPTSTPSVHDAELTASALLQGIPVQVLKGVNHIEVIETQLKILALRIQAGLQSGGMVAPAELSGLQALSQHIAQHIAIIGQDKSAENRVKQYVGVLTKLSNELKGFAQRLQEAAKKQQQQAQAGAQQGPQLDPKDVAKIQGLLLTAKAKADIAKQSAAQRTAQRDIQFQQKIRQQQAQHGADIAGKDIEVASNLRRTRMEEEEAVPVRVTKESA